MNIIEKILKNPRKCAICGITETIPNNIIIEYCTINVRQCICDDCLCELDDDYFITMEEYNERF